MGKNVGRFILGFTAVALLTALLLVIAGVPLADISGVGFWRVSAYDSAKDLNAQRPTVEAEDSPLVGEAKEDAFADAVPGGQKTGSADAQPGQNTQKNEGQQTDDRNGQETDAAGGINWTSVGDSYFSDALFIGDSRTVGMQQSGLLPDAAYYAKTGIGIGKILDTRIAPLDGAQTFVEEALCRRSFGKVYIMAGINDMAAGDVEWFLEQYREIIALVRKTQPDALIYIQGNIPMSSAAQDTQGGTLTNENLRLRNEASRTLADGSHIFYLDTQDIYADAQGCLDSGYTADGLHVRRQYYGMWVDYLKHHAYVP